MGRQLLYSPWRHVSPEGLAAGLYDPDTRKPSSYSRSKLPKCRRLRATFFDEDGRYASINGIIYPALLKSCLYDRRYKEDVRDGDDYPVDWCRQFLQELNCRATAVLVSDADEDNWKFLGLFHVHDVELSSFLTCRIGAKLADLNLRPEP